MTYFTGSTANTANPAKDFMELILHPNLLTAGFTYVEEVIASGTARIYKSASAANGVGDWHLIIFRATDAITAIYFGVSEGYDSGTHLAQRFAPRGASGVAGGNSLPADRSHYTTAGVAPLYYDNSPWAIGVGTTAHSYLLSLHVKRVVISTKVVAAETAAYVGLYDPTLPAIANHFPLCISAFINSTNLTSTSYTREPGTGTSVGTVNGRGSFTDPRAILPGQVGLATSLTADPVALDGYYNKPTVARVFVPGSQSKAGSRGLAIGLYGADNAFAWGDVANIDWAGTSITATCVSSTTAADCQRLVDQAF